MTEAKAQIWKPIVCNCYYEKCKLAQVGCVVMECHGRVPQQAAQCEGW